ncbi:helix-turn-helix transcriptional regulator [Photobacterium leiognathi]|uniref:helix-turn-helix transcriptional regulator n=1 Tax=Photobacterium leiognathi TaxID=553611 RepID=UPI0029813A56|nr:metalloregulator ArsR/SmtB family transcription factor [Photobacterium leiognathi]
MKTIEKILYHLKSEGPVTAKVLAEKFELTTMGIRQHLQGLEEDGLVDFTDVKVKVGRPTRHWQLTEKGHRRFADRHHDLAVHMLESVEDLFGKAGLDQVIAKREQQTYLHYQQALSSCENLDDKLARLTQLRAQDGYMAELITTENGYTLVENHCPICRAAQHCPTLCQSEMTVFQRLLGDDVSIERQEHIISGQRRCTYRITLSN